MISELQRVAANRALNNFISSFDPDEVRFFIMLVRSAIRAVNEGGQFETIRDDFLGMSHGHRRDLRKYINFCLFTKNMDISVAQMFKAELLALESDLCDLLEPGAAVKLIQGTVRSKAKVSDCLPHSAHVLPFLRRNYAELTPEQRRIAREDNTFRSDVMMNFDGKCSVSGLRMQLTAAHLMPRALTGSFDVSNGITLTHTLHHAFDQHAFAIEPLTLRLVVAPAWQHVFAFHGETLIMPRFHTLDPAALDFRYELFNELNGLSTKRAY